MDWTSSPLVLHKSWLIDLQMPDGEEILGLVRDENLNLISEASAWRPNANNPIMFIDAKAERWVVDGVYHREDGPALTWADGTKFWYTCGVCEMIQRPDGSLEDGYELVEPGVPTGRLAKPKKPAKLSKARATSILADALESAGCDVNSEIISKFTIAGMQYFTDIIKTLAAR